MKSTYLDYWKTSVGDKGIESGKLHIYRKIKSEFKMEPYLHQIKQLKYRRAMSMFRISAHRLEIETGRWIKTSSGNNKICRNDRICTLCFENGSKIPGDEEHAILVCPIVSSEKSIC